MTTPFTGQRLPPVDLPVKLISQTVHLNAGASTVLTPGTLGYDMSQFQSLKCNISGASNGTQPFYEILFSWFVDSSAQIEEEAFTFYNPEEMFGHVMVHAPYMQLGIVNYDSVANDITINLYGSTRDIPRSQFHVGLGGETSGRGSDNFLYNNQVNIAASTTTNYGPIHFYNGPAVVRFKCTNTGNVAAGCLELSINAEPKGQFTSSKHLSFTVPAIGTVPATNQPLVQEIYLPRRVCSVQIDNNDTSAHTVGWSIFAGEI